MAFDLTCGIQQSNLKLPLRKDCVYTSCYCEENVWKLCKFLEKKHDESLDSCYAVFISNEDKMIPIWMQKSAKDIREPVLWDYHVIFVYHSSGRVLIYDLDTVLPFPCDFVHYVEAAFQKDDTLQEKYERKFRVVAAEEYLQRFASDRSHMKRGSGEWQAPPPDYPCIRTSVCTMNLPDFICMNPDTGYGSVLDQASFIEMFIGPSKFHRDGVY